MYIAFDLEYVFAEAGRTPLKKVETLLQKTSDLLWSDPLYETEIRIALEGILGYQMKLNFTRLLASYLKQLFPRYGRLLKIKQYACSENELEAPPNILEAAK
jgi:hypothetical protein